MAVQCRKDAASPGDYYVKGSLDNLLEKATHVLVRQGEHRAIGQMERDRIRAIAEEFATEGYRVLALAEGEDLNHLSLIGEGEGRAAQTDLWARSVLPERVWHRFSPHAACLVLHSRSGLVAIADHARKGVA